MTGGLGIAGGQDQHVGGFDWDTNDFHDIFNDLDGGWDGIALLCSSFESSAEVLNTILNVGDQSTSMKPSPNTVCNLLIGSGNLKTSAAQSHIILHVERL